MEKTFLIIDDDINIRKMLTLVIKKNNLGKVICELGSGEEAVQEILFYNPDVVLIDLLLPKRDGIEIIKYAKKQGYNGRFIMISQVEESDMISKAYESGVVFFINKPINSIEVINVIKGVCHNIELEKSLALIKNTILNFNNENDSIKKLSLDDSITNIFTDIGIVGVVGNSDIRKVIHKIISIRRRDSHLTYKLHKIYEEIVIEESGEENIIQNKKALEQRIRRAIQKSLSTIAELGCDDYSNNIFMEYGTLLFDFSQVRTQMRYLTGTSKEQGKINTKKFIEGIITKLKV